MISIPSLPGFGVGMGGRSDTVSRWKPEEFRKAREEWDPRLVAAITAYGTGKAASDNAAKLLVDLLQAPATSSPTPSAPPQVATGAATSTPVAAASQASPTVPARPILPPPPLPDVTTIKGKVPYNVIIHFTEEFITPEEVVKAGEGKTPKQFPAGFRFGPGSTLPDWLVFPASAKIEYIARVGEYVIPPELLIQPADSPLQLYIMRGEGMDGWGQIPDGYEVQIFKPLAIPADIAKAFKQDNAFVGPGVYPAGYCFFPGVHIPKDAKVTRVPLTSGAGAGAAASATGTPQLGTDEQGNVVIPDGVTVTLTEPMALPPEIAKKLNLPEGAQLPAGFTIPSGYKFPPGFTLPPNAKVTSAGPTAGGVPNGMPAFRGGPGSIAPALPPTEEQVVEAIVLALGANKTETARSALRKLLKGETRTAVPEELVSGFAAQAMLIRPTEKEEAGLVAAAANPSVIRKGVIPEGLQAALLKALDQKATSKMRIALVDAVNKPTATGDQRKAVMAMIAKPRAENLPAQARMFANPKLEPAVKKAMFEQFAAYSAAAMDQIMQTKPGNPKPSAPGATDPAAAAAADPATPPAAADPAASGAAPGPVAPMQHLDDKTLAAVIEGVWGADVTERVKADGARSDEFTDFEMQLPLAVTMPVSEARAALLGIVRDNFVAGPSALAMGGSLGERLRDPGTLFVVKRSPRMEKPPEKPKKEGEDAAADRPRRNRSGRPVDAEKEKERKEKKEKEDKAHYDWMAASEEFSRALSDRFYAAAQAGGGQRHKVMQETSGAATAVGSRKLEPINLRFPLKLHEGARITAEYHMCLPEDLPEGLKGVNMPPLVVHYVRTEDVSSFPKVNSTYLAQLKGVNSHVRSGSRWLDWTGPGAVGGMSRTVDVFLTRNGEAAPPPEGGKAKAEDAIPIVTEILVIEVPSFRAPRDSEE